MLKEGRNDEVKKISKIRDWGRIEEEIGQRNGGYRLPGWGVIRYEGTWSCSE